MAEIKISCSHIKHKDQLTKENLSLIFKSYYEDHSLQVEQVRDNAEGKVGEHYQSEISKLSVKLKNDINPIRLIVKEPIGQSLPAKINSRLVKPFMREAFWYTEAVPVLKNVDPEIESMSPKCFHAMTPFQDDYQPKGGLHKFN